MSPRTDRIDDPTWRCDYAAMLRAYLPFYASETLRGPAAYGGRFLLGPHHVDWGDALRLHRRILELAARDHGKSYSFCFAYPIWMADVRAPRSLGYIFSATAGQAEDHLRKIRDEVVGGGEFGEAGNPKLAHLLPLKKDTARTLRFANGSEIRARGFGTRVRGGHPFWAVADDVLNDDHLWSDGVRKKAIDYFLSAIEPMVVPGGQLVVVGTPFHNLDLYAHLETTGEFHVGKHPCYLPDGSPMWPARYDRAALETKRRILGSSLRWSREFLCTPISDDSSLFPSTLFETPGVKLPYPLGLPGHYWRDNGVTTYMGVDLSLSASARADWFVCFVLGVAPNGDRYVVDIVRRQGIGYQEQVDTVVGVARRYGCAMVFCEANQYQRVITDMVVRESDVPIKAFYTTGRGGSRQATSARRGMQKTYSSNKNALDQGVPSLRMLLENGKIRVPWAEETREVVQLWITEMVSFSWAQGRLQGVGAHDDTVMGLWMADRAAAVGESFDLGVEDDSPLGPEESSGDDRGPGSSGDDWFGMGSSVDDGVAVG